MAKKNDITVKKKKKKYKKRGRPKKPKNKGGQPTVMTEDVLKKLKEAFKLGATDEEACSYADISTTAFYDYQKRTKGYAEKKQAWKESPNLIARQAVIRDMAKDGSLALKYLERKKKDEFSLRKEITGGDGKSLSVLLDRQESDYDDLGQQAKQQMVENEPPVLHKGQAGESEAVQSEPDTSNASGGEGQSQEGSDTQS